MLNLEEIIRISKMLEVSLYDELQTGLETLISIFPGHIYWKDIYGLFVACNKAQAISAGFQDSKDMLGKSDYDMPWKDNADEISKTDKEVMETKIPIVRTEVNTLSDGREIIYLSHKVPLINKEGVVIGIMGISTDITNIHNI